MNDSTKPRSSFRPLGFLIVAALAASLVTSLALRPLPEAHAERASEAATATATETQSQTESGTKQGSAGPSEAGADSAAIISAAPTPPPEPIEPKRPLRVVGLGWELLAPGVVANDGLRPGEASEFSEAGLALEFAVALSTGELEARLARGGGVDNGADIALLPLATFVASYEQLRALSPEVFFVIGWSQGRDAVAAEDPALLTSVGAKVKELVGFPGQPATLLALFALDAIGVDIGGLELVSPLSKDAANKPVSAIERSLQASVGAAVDARRLVLTSADAPRLIPMVAVAPASFIRSNTNDLARFCRVWLQGVERFDADVPDAARRVAKETGAPEAVALLEMIGYINFADLSDAARSAGLSGRGAITLERLFQRSWALWRAIGVLSTPAPEHAPLDNSVIARVALGEGAPSLLRHAEPGRAGERLVLVQQIALTKVAGKAALDEQALVDELAFLAGAFERGEIELSVRKDKDASRRIVAAAIERYDLDPDHLRVGPSIRGREPASVRVLTP